MLNLQTVRSVYIMWGLNMANSQSEEGGWPPFSHPLGKALYNCMIYDEIINLSIQNLLFKTKVDHDVRFEKMFVQV